MPTRKTTSSKSQTNSVKNSTGKKVTRSSGKSKATTVSSLEKNLASLNTKSKRSGNTSKTSTRTTSGSTTTTRKKKDRGVKHTRCKDKSLFPHYSMPWRMEPRTGKFNLSWYMCFDHAVDQIERSHLQPKDYKLQCYTSVPITDPLTGPVRTQRYVT
nr:hypothetical protein [uncultured Mediterranean phage uvMED]